MSTRLQREVWAQDRCSGCGACVAACAKGVLRWGDQHPLLEEREKRLGLSRLKLRTCEVCDRFCEQSCPRLEEPAPLEAWRAVSARAAGAVRPADPDSIAQGLLVAARVSGLIDGAIVLDMDPWSLMPVARIVTTVDEITGGVGMQFLWAPVLDRLNEAVFGLGLTRLAVVATPCVAAGARRLRETADERLRPYRVAIRLTIARFCTGMYLPGLVSDLLARGMGIPSERIRRLETREAEGVLRVALWDGAEKDVPLAEVQPYTRRGCGNCHDYLGEAADLAVGVVGALPRHAALIVRSARGEALVQNAIGLQLLQIASQVDEAALREACAVKERRARAESLAECRILMLESVSDVRKRAHVRQRFAALYGRTEAAVLRKEEPDGGCAGCAGSGC